MKIYLPEHDIRATQYIGIKDTPLAYINTNENKYSVAINIENDYVKQYKKLVRPYQEFTDPETLLFDADEKLIKDVELKRLGNRYVYEPQGGTEYTPTTFSCVIILKKNIEWKNNRLYDINVHVADDTRTTLSNKLITIFGDAWKRGIAPSNIKINSGDMTTNKLINFDFKDSTNDFIFYESDDGTTIMQGDKKVKLDINAILDTHTNLWVSVKDFNGMLKTTKGKNEIIIDDPILFNKKIYTQNSDVVYFDKEKENTEFPKVEYDYEFLCNSILILHKKNKGYIIVTPDFLLNDLKTNSNLVYEAMMYVYLKSYIELHSNVGWITDVPIDYVAYQENRFNSKQSKFNLIEIIKNAGLEHDDQYSIASVATDNPNVVFVSLAANNDMFFCKVNAATDPIKKESEISYYTTKHTVMHYQQKEIYIVDNPINIESTINDTGIYITVHPTCSSTYKLNTTSDQTIKVENPDAIYFLCADIATLDIANVFQLIRSDLYNETDKLRKIATIVIHTETNTKLYDIRVLGGGIPQSHPDDYDMIDIGNVYGRPYRIGSTMIIRLPKKYQQYKDLIEKEIHRHCSSGDYPVLVFE